ncbi:putative cation diffusion facilitator [Corchorus olitorius]|uniref:Cation diffusion facilitator n=1 Tax=Corchorus olitorius TaxID=93759 RepID=A0A1R3KUC6_9ROSI|nr:putative cation diffusion facilitator [Corchorus olitorius]
MATATDRFHLRKVYIRRRYHRTSQRTSYLLSSQLLNCDCPSQIIVNYDKRHGVGAGVHPVADGQFSGQSLTLIRRICLSQTVADTYFVRRNCLKRLSLFVAEL